MKFYTPIFLLCLAWIVSLASDASACNRCGRFGNQCSFVAHHSVVHQPAIAVTPVAAIQQPSVFAITNVYPAANTYGGQGLPLTAQQGNTLYTLGQTEQFRPVDPNQLVHSVMSLYNSANQGALVALRGANDHMSIQASYSHAQALPIAQATAARIVLDAAGIHPQAQQYRQQQSGYKITFDAAGQPKVEHLHAEQLQGFRGKYPQFDPNGYPGQKPPCDPVGPSPSPFNPNPNSMLSLKCGKCHGSDLANPKKGLRIDGSQALDCMVVARSRKAINSGSMPQGETLDEATKQKLLDELDQLVKLDQ